MDYGAVSARVGFFLSIFLVTRCASCVSSLENLVGPDWNGFGIGGEVLGALGGETYAMAEPFGFGLLCRSSLMQVLVFGSSINGMFSL